MEILRLVLLSILEKLSFLTKDFFTLTISDHLGGPKQLDTKTYFPKEYCMQGINKSVLIFTPDLNLPNSGLDFYPIHT